MLVKNPRAACEEPQLDEYLASQLLEAGFELSNYLYLK